MREPRFLVSPVGLAGHLGWRLLSPNNRPLGCAAATYPDLGPCTAEIDRIRAAGGALRAVQSLDLVAGSWVWRVELDGRVVAVSSRSYDGQRECESNLRLFLASVARARVVTTDLRHITLPAPRRVIDLSATEPTGSRECLDV